MNQNFHSGIISSGIRNYINFFLVCEIFLILKNTYLILGNNQHKMLITCES